jgi:trehalose 6-phosphate phosphatase
VDFPGVRVEDKRDSIAVHYRQAPAVAKVLGQRLLRIIAEIGGLTLLPGKAVWEVKGAGYDKGTAVVELMRSPVFRGRRPAFLGDDVADEDAFRAAEALGGLGLRVGPVADGRPAAFAAPAEVRRWLAELPRHISSSGR